MKSVDRAEMLFACLAEDIRSERAQRRGPQGMSVMRFCPLEDATPSVLAYLERLVRRWQEGDGT